MPRFGLTSDLHFDLEGTLTPAARVIQLVDDMAASSIDAILVAGDIGHPFDNYVGCLDALANRQVPVGIVAGNHDVWSSAHLSSEELWTCRLAEEARRRGILWLEEDTLVLGDTAVVGSVAWYDYSAADPALGLDEDYYEQVKPKLSNDARWIDWPWSDRAIAENLRGHLVSRLEMLQEDSRIRDIVIVTHVPVFEEQMLRPERQWESRVLAAYFGNLKTGDSIRRFSKVRLVVSGHLHASVDAVVEREGMPNIRAVVVGSNYGNPIWIGVSF